MTRPSDFAHRTALARQIGVAARNTFAPHEADQLTRAVRAWRAIDRTEYETPAWWEALSNLRNVIDRMERWGQP